MNGIKFLKINPLNLDDNRKMKSGNKFRNLPDAIEKQKKEATEFI